MILLLMMLILSSMPAYAATSSKMAHLHFYTVDGLEVSELEVKVRSGEFTFPDPDNYKYIGYTDGLTGETIYDPLNDQVKGLYWEEIVEYGTPKQYKAGEKVKLEPGDYEFRVKTDNPTLTGENALYLKKSDKVYLSFFSADWDYKEDLDRTISTVDEFTFPSPKEYGTDGYMGTYWSCTDDNGYTYLFKEGEKVHFRSPGNYQMVAVTDKPVHVSFRYPIDLGSYYLVIDRSPGDLYAEMTVHVGDTITLKRSLGAIAWNMSFVGWEEAEWDFGTYRGGEQFQIMDNHDLVFFALYEDDDDWDPDARDENIGKTIEEIKEKESYVVSGEEVNSKAGVGYNAYIDNSGKLQRKKGQPINDSTSVEGIPGTIKAKNDLTSLVEGGDSKDPADYTKDKYGRKTEESNIADTINGVLRQDDSAMHMDIYGNAFVYYSSLTRLQNLCVAYARLKEGKNDSFVTVIESWDENAINRYEAVEFALLCNVYPGKNNSEYKMFNSNSAEAVAAKAVVGLTEKDLLPEWKDEYLCESAFNYMKPFKKVWGGWLDNYDDGLVEKYTGDKKHSGGKLIGMLKDAVSGFENPFCITAYAATSNPVGTGLQYGARLNYTVDAKGMTFSPIYYDPSLMTSFGRYGFSSLSGLGSAEADALRRIFNYMVKELGYTEEMAAGACGNLWQECNFNYHIGNGQGGAVGLVQWTGGRKDNLMRLASSRGTSWEDLDMQLAYMKQELDSSYTKNINAYLSKYAGGTSVLTIKNVELATEAWCAAYEGCVCKNGNRKNGGYHESHGGYCEVAANGVSYQELSIRKEYAERIYNALVVYSGASIGCFSGMSNSDILMSIFGYGTKKEIEAHYTESQLARKCVSVTLSNGKSITVNKAIADDTKAALDELLDSGFDLDNTTCGYNYRTIDGSTSLSFHSFGLAIDINCGPDSKKSMGYAHNPVWRTTQFGKEEVLKNYTPLTDPLAISSKEAAILAKHGFAWGRDIRNKPDIMHFSVAEITHIGENAWVTDLVEGGNALR